MNRKIRISSILYKRISNNFDYEEVPVEVIKDLAEEYGHDPRKFAVLYGRYKKYKQELDEYLKSNSLYSQERLHRSNLDKFFYGFINSLGNLTQDEFEFISQINKIYGLKRSDLLPDNILSIFKELRQHGSDSNVFRLMSATESSPTKYKEVLNLNSRFRNITTLLGMFSRYLEDLRDILPEQFLTFRRSLTRVESFLSNISQELNYFMSEACNGRHKNNIRYLNILESRMINSGTEQDLKSFQQEVIDLFPFVNKIKKHPTYTHQFYRIYLRKILASIRLLLLDIHELNQANISE